MPHHNTLLRFLLVGTAVFAFACGGDDNETHKTILVPTTQIQTTQIQTTQIQTTATPTTAIPTTAIPTMQIQQQ